MKRSLAVLALLTACAPFAFSQAKTAASRAGDLQLGGGFTIANSDYVPNKIRGLALYGDFDFKEHWGGEFDFHQISDPRPTQVYERSYEVGGRYFRTYKNRYKPYAKVLFGRGVFNFPLGEANLAYNMAVAGGGIDIVVHPRINVRADFEYQDWFSGPGLHDGLSPALFTIGVAYHFPGGNARR